MTHEPGCSQLNTWTTWQVELTQLQRSQLDTSQVDTGVNSTHGQLDTWVNLKAHTEQFNCWAISHTKKTAIKAL